MFLDDQDNLEYTDSKEFYIKMHTGCDDIPVRILGSDFDLTNVGKCAIFVNGFGGYIPHFEIQSEDGTFKSCLQIYKAEYYFRNQACFSKLTNQQIDDLIQCLNKKTDYGLTIHNWICVSWRNMNSEKKYYHYDEADFTPDYNRLKEII